MNDIYEKTDDYTPNKKRRVLIIFDEMIAGILSEKNFEQQ